MAGLIGLSVLIAEESEPEIPSINDFLPDPLLFQDTPFAINRIILIRIIATVVLLLILGCSALRAKLIPGRWQGFIESAIDFVRYQVVYNIMGEARGKRYVPMIVTIFFTISIFNMCGVIPGANIAATATIMMPMVFALWVLVQYWIAAAREQGLKSFIRAEVFPKGVPWPIYIILSPIQIFELLIVKPASLTIRLFANMIAGHLLVATFMSFTHYWIVQSGDLLVGLPVGFLWFLGAFALTCFEAFVAVLQAYVFSILATVYINQSYPEEEHVELS